MSIVTIQSKLIANSKAVKILKNKRFCLIYLVFYIANKQIIKMSKGKRFYLIHLAAHKINKQAMKVLEDRKIC